MRAYSSETEHRTETCVTPFERGKNGEHFWAIVIGGHQDINFGPIWAPPGVNFRGTTLGANFMRKNNSPVFSLSNSVLLESLPSLFPEIKALKVERFAFKMHRNAMLKYQLFL